MKIHNVLNKITCNFNMINHRTLNTLNSKLMIIHIFYNKYFPRKKNIKSILNPLYDIPDLGNVVIGWCPCCNSCLIVKDKMVGLFQYNEPWTSLAVIRNFKFEFYCFIYMGIDCSVSWYLRRFIFYKKYVFT